MHTSFHHMRHLTNSGELSPFGGVTFYGELLDVGQSVLGDQVWEVAAAATHSSDRFIRKTGNALAKQRYQNFETFIMPAGERPHFGRDLYAHLAATGGKVYKQNNGLNNMIRNVYAKVVKPPKLVITDKSLPVFVNDSVRAIKADHLASTRLLQVYKFLGQEAGDSIYLSSLWTGMTNMVMGRYDRI